MDYFVSPEGLRQDGRAPKDIRKLRASLGVLPAANGSAYIEQGNTKVLCSVYGPHEPRGQRDMVDKVIVNCHLSIAPFALTTRRRRPLGVWRAQEMATAIGDALEAAMLTSVYPRSQIDVYIQVLQADGSILCVGMNAATLATIDAGIPLSDYVCACTATYLEKKPLVDMNHTEEMGKGPDLSVGLLPNSSGKLSMVQMNSKVHRDDLEKVFGCAMKGCIDVYTLLNAIVKQSASVE